MHGALDDDVCVDCTPGGRCGEPQRQCGQFASSDTIVDAPAQWAGRRIHSVTLDQTGSPPLAAMAESSLVDFDPLTELGSHHETPTLFILVTLWQPTLNAPLLVPGNMVQLDAAQFTMVHPMI